MWGRDGAEIIVALGGGIVLLLALWARQWIAQRRALLRAARASRFLRALSQANRMILRAQDEAQLWREACEICVATGKSVLACVYVREGMAAHRVACAGPAIRMLENVPAILDMSQPELRASYTARALFDGERLVSNDYVLDPRAGRWRQEAVEQGVRAIAWIPLRRGGSVVAALMLCADARDYFDAELLRSLDELGEDLSLALDAIERNRERLAAQHEVEAGRDRFRALFDAAPLPMAIVSIAERRILEANEALCRWYGLQRTELVGSRTAAHAYGLVSEDRDRFYRTLDAEGAVSHLQLRVRDARGREHLEAFDARPIEYLGQACCLVTSFDLRGLQSPDIQSPTATPAGPAP